MLFLLGGAGGGGALDFLPVAAGGGFAFAFGGDGGLGLDESPELALVVGVRFLCKAASKSPLPAPGSPPPRFLSFALPFALIFALGGPAFLPNRFATAALGFFFPLFFPGGGGGPLLLPLGIGGGGGAPAFFFFFFFPLFPGGGGGGGGIFSYF